jgi:hypothetical protein
LNIKEKLKVVGNFQIFENGKLIKTFNNLITNILLDDMIGILAGYPANLDIRYIGLGTDNTAVAVGDTALGVEYSRSKYVSRGLTAPPTYGEIVTDFYISSSEGNTDIEELGIFCGNLATSVADSGKLISHVLWSYTKTSSVELLIRYTITLS